MATAGDDLPVTAAGPGCPAARHGHGHGTLRLGALVGPLHRRRRARAPAWWCSSPAARCAACTARTRTPGADGRGRRHALDDVERLMARYRPFIDASGGGFTLSGRRAASAARVHETAAPGRPAAGLHTALDTSGFLGRRADDRAARRHRPGAARHQGGHRRRAPPAHRPADRPDVGVRPAARRAWAARPGSATSRPRLTPRPAASSTRSSRSSPSSANVERVEILPFHTLGAAEVRAARHPLPARRYAAAPRELVGAVRERMLAAGLTVF